MNLAHPATANMFTRYVRFGRVNSWNVSIIYCAFCPNDSSLNHRTIYSSPLSHSIGLIYIYFLQSNHCGAYPMQSSIMMTWWPSSFRICHLPHDQTKYLHKLDGTRCPAANHGQRLESVVREHGNCLHKLPTLNSQSMHLKSFSTRLMDENEVIKCMLLSITDRWLQFDEMISRAPAHHDDEGVHRAIKQACLFEFSDGHICSRQTTDLIRFMLALVFALWNIDARADRHTSKGARAATVFREYCRSMAA